MKRRKISRRTLRTIGAVIVLIGGGIIVPWGKVADRLIPPRSAEDIYRIGRDAMAKNDVPTVQFAAEALAELDDARPYAPILEGYVHLKSGRVREAVAAFEAVQNDPQTGGLANMLAGEVLYRNGQHGDAIDAFDAAVTLDPSLTDAHRMLAAVLYDLGSSSRAIQELRIVSQQDPSDPRPHRLMGLMNKDMESFEPAITEYREALRRDPNLPERNEVLIELATCLFKLARYEELAEILPQCPQTAERFALEAELLLVQGKPDEAERIANEGLATHPKDLELLLVKGSIQLFRGQLDESVETFRKAVESHPKEYRAHHKLSQAYSRQGNGELASMSNDEMVRLRNLREHFADLHAKASIDSHNADLRYQLGKTARELGREDLAVPWFRSALSLDPQHAQARAALEGDK